MRWYVILILFFLVVGYLFIGGAVFRALESDNEQETKTMSRKNIDMFLANFTCMNRDQLERLLTSVINAYEQGVRLESNVSGTSEVNDNWNLISSIFFSSTVITTIGYGHVSPSTTRGRIFCIFYAILGIPLCALFLAGVGEQLHRPVKKIKNRINSGCARGCVAFLVYLMVTCLLVFLPSFGFYRSEEWTYFESLYYAVITLTTIGFGDFVPGTFGDDSVIMRRVLTIVWIFVGLAWVSSMFSAVQDFISDHSINNNEKKAGRAELNGVKNNNTERISSTELSSF